ncbi:hypothetical protein SPRG_14538 [Saprolegnia parasitica CBS 223.65]|uniref:Uncharacterized protein n=1 Tax=Saprolegnia parasitica (strain CBS 223.65) TaxID=695850 RepID=A0A067BYK5_SAPPC|nr:hypothetical protein SPRG_14538 [Saprolegnia parasitica CBS 223.65]KDO19637.1 hypothetical protein SPRG_14538 [Saprolegnia parasitica CBS 223.65]|eukprot:XP_012209638.1 hypothetical protein SPRG_14538 [Saprolegnia parasitica CBS 223.65]
MVAEKRRCRDVAGSSPLYVRGYLGEVVAALRRTRTGVNPTVVTALNALGFQWTLVCYDTVDVAMQLVVASFPTHPPTSCVVPAQARWPRDLWGTDVLRLSARRDARLVTMASAYDASLLSESTRAVSTEKRVDQAQLVLASITIYVALHGPTSVPLLFHVPSCDDMWPMDAALKPLGFLVWAMRD